VTQTSKKISNKEAIKIAHSLRDNIPGNHIHLLESCEADLGENLRSFGFQVSDGTQAPGDASFTFWAPATCNHPEVALGAGAENLVVLFPKFRKPGSRVALVGSLVAGGYVPDYSCCLDTMPRDALLLKREHETDLLSTTQAVETQLRQARLQRQELERRLEVRLAQLEDAQIRIEALREALRQEKEVNRPKLRHAQETARRWKQKYAELEQRLDVRVARRLLPLIRRAEETRTRLKRSIAKRAKSDEQSDTAPAIEDSPGSEEGYHAWMLRHRPPVEDLEALRSETVKLRSQPLFTLLVTSGTAEELRALVDSLRAQIYDRWELMPLGAAVDSDAWRGLETEDDRIKRGEGDRQTIAGGLHASTGNYAMIIPGNVVLEPNALAEFALAADKGADLIYSDEDCLSSAGQYEHPFFKPDWSPDTFLSANYLGSVTAVARDVATSSYKEPCPGEPLSGYDFLLRATERAERIVHIPKVLWHQIPSGTSVHPAEEIFALERALERRGIEAEVSIEGGHYRVKRRINEEKKVTIIIPTRDRVELLKQCIESVVARTDYGNYELVIVDNDSKEPATFEYYKTISHRILHYEGQFNYSAMNNYAVAQTEGDWLLLLNNDIEVTQGDWLRAMVEHIQRPEIGVVGAQLLYPDNTVQHAGVILGVHGIGSHAFARTPAGEPGARGQLQMIRNYSAVTGACLLTRRKLFEQVGGLDERTFAVSFNDIDLCLKIRKAGYLVVYTPYAQLYHYESASRGMRYENPNEARAFFEKWGADVARDPYYNPNLTTTRNDFSPRED
jgi:GT2 family glycosyltransferase